MEEKIYTRKELYDYLWTEPVSSLLKKYNISYQVIRKICDDMNIPIPKNGHWMKIKFGKKVSILPLPGDYSGEDIVKFKIKNAEDFGSLKSISPQAILKREIEKDSTLAIAVKERLANPDKLIIETKNSFTKNDWHSDNGLIKFHDNALSLKVTPPNLTRALLFMDALIKNLQTRGHSVYNKYQKTIVLIEDEEIEIRLLEKLEMIKVLNEFRRMENKYQPTGKLSFNIKFSYGKAEWKDDKTLLEFQLSKIISRLELEGRKMKEESLRWKIIQAESNEKERIQLLIAQQKQDEIKNFKKLLNQATRWNQANNLRNYIDAVEKKAIEEQDASGEIKEWINWAREKTDKYDPCISGNNKGFKDMDKIEEEYVEDDY